MQKQKCKWQRMNELTTCRDAATGNPNLTSVYDSKFLVLRFLDRHRLNLSDYAEAKCKGQRMNYELTCGDAATENTNLIQRSRWIDLGEASRVNNSVLTEGGGSDEVAHRFAVNGEPRLSVAEHHLSVGVYAKQLAHIALRRLAVPAFPALPREQWKHVIPFLQICYAFPYAFHYSVHK